MAINLRLLAGEKEPYDQNLLDIIQGVFWDDRRGQPPNEEDIGYPI